MIIHLNEDIFHKLFIAEGKLTTQAKNRTYQVLKNGNSWVASVIDNPCTEDGMDGSITYFDWVYKEITSHWCRQNIKLTPVIANILFNELGFMGINPQADKIAMFGKIVPLFESDPKLGSLPWNEAIKYTYNDLYNYFMPQIEQKEQETTDKINNETYGQSDYDIMHLKNYELATRFSDYTGGYMAEGHKICYTTSRNTWNNFTNNGEYNVYVCLKHGFESVKPKPGEDAPFDEYGLSMIFVIVDTKGKLTTSNVRWNHAYVEQWNRNHRNEPARKVDSILDEYEISKIINRNFKETFTGKYNLGLKELEEKIKTADDFWSISAYFDLDFNIGKGFYLVKYDNNFNVVDFNSRKFVFKDWYDEITSIRNGIVNITDMGVSMLFDVFDSREITRRVTGIKFVNVMESGAVVMYINDESKLKYLYNLENEMIIRNEPYKSVEAIFNGLAYVKCTNDFYSIINMETGEALWHEYYQKLYFVGNDWVILQNLDGQYYIFNNRTRTLLNENGYDEICYDKKKLANELLFDKLGSRYSPGRYVLVKIGGLYYAQFEHGELRSISSPDVCGYDEHEKYEEMAKELDDFMHNAPYPFGHKNYMEGLYDFYVNRKETDGLLEIAEDYVKVNGKSILERNRMNFDAFEPEKELDKLTYKYMEAARMLAIDYHYVFDEMRSEDEYEGEQQ
jgi:hypothetical protein